MQLLCRLRAAANRDLLLSAGSLIGTTVITAGLGFVYWWLAARLFPQAAVGFASALIAAMGLLGSLGMLGLGTLLIGELPRRPGERAALVTTALLAAGAAAALLGLLFALVAPLASAEFASLAGDPAAALLFPAGVALTAVTLVLDQALIGLMRGGLQLWRNALFAVIKLGLLPPLGLWAARSGGLVIYASWAAGNLLSLAALALIARRDLRRAAARPRLALLRDLPGAALWHHALNLALQLPGLALPVVVTALLSAELNATFYMCWLTLHLVFAIPYTLTTVLFAAGAAEPAAFAQKARLTLALSTGLGALSCLAVWLGAELILGIFGQAYAAQGAWTFRIMALGVFPLIIKDHFVAVSRVNGTIRRTALVAALGSALELGASAAGASLGGLSGLAVGFVLALALEALYMARAVYLVARPLAPAVTAIEPLCSVPEHA
jgi:O-antigen/teichoic acid export membrane protein